MGFSKIRGIFLGVPLNKGSSTLGRLGGLRYEGHLIGNLVVRGSYYLGGLYLSS